MDNDYINGGFILLSRHILNSDIWKKPPEYLKIFIYILLKVNHKDGLFPRGSNFFNFSEERIPGVTAHQIYHFLKWASTEGNILAKQKTTRGVVLKVNNYDRYQTIENYELRNELRNDCEIVAKQLRNDCDTINKNERMKELNNVNSITPKETKKIYGSFKNVKLTDKEHARFIEEFGEANTNKVIEHLSAYKEEKGYKTKSDNLTIRRWVLDACRVKKIDANYGGF